MSQQSQHVQNQSQRVTQIVTHFRPDLDEIAAIYLGRRFGEGVLPGISSAKLVILRKEIERTYDDDIYVGIGGRLENPRGVVVDEHTSDGRIEDECAATMMARRIGLPYSGPRAWELLSEILWCDREPKVAPTQLANMVKAMHRVKKGEGQAKTVQWAEDALDAIISGRFDHKYDTLAAWSRYRQVAGLDPEEEAVKTVERFIAEACGRKRRLLTDLPHIAARLDTDIRKVWLDKAFEILVADAREYQKALKSRFDTVDIDTDSGMVPLMFMTSESEHAVRVANSSFFGKAMIVIVRNSMSGHTFIGIDPKRGEPLFESFAHFGAMIRMAEYHERTGRKLPFADAHGLGEVDKVPEWHMPFPNLFLNGTPTHPEVRKSKLAIEEIVSISKSAFNTRLRDTWLSQFGRPKPVARRDMIAPDVEISLEAELRRSEEKENAQ